MYSMARLFAKSAFDAFAKETGITVEATPYDSVETPETKLLTGGSGVDLVLSAGFTVPHLIKEKAIV